MNSDEIFRDGKKFEGDLTKFRSVIKTYQHIAKDGDPQHIYMIEDAAETGHPRVGIESRMSAAWWGVIEDELAQDEKKPYGSCVLLARLTPAGKCKLSIESVEGEWSEVEPCVSRLVEYLQVEGWVQSSRQPTAKPDTRDQGGEKPIQDNLGKREIEVFQLVKAGKDRQGIADKLTVSVKTIDTHIQNISRKLDLSITKSVDDLRKQWLEKTSHL